MDKSGQLYHVKLPSGANYGVIVKDGIIVHSAPMGKKFVGESIYKLTGWVEKQGGSVKTTEEAMASYESPKRTVYYAGVGSRRTPGRILDKMEEIAQNLAKKGYHLRSGGAEGADSAFDFGRKKEYGPGTVYLPWKGFSPEPGIVMPDNAHAEAIARKFHPAWGKLTPGMRRLQTRNSYQVLGDDLQTPSDFVIAWTVGGKGGGGTGQAIRIAKALGIPVFDLGDPNFNEDAMYAEIEKIAAAPPAKRDFSALPPAPKKEQPKPIVQDMKFRMPAGSIRKGLKHPGTDATILDSTTFDLIELGVRTASTRSYALGPVGSLIRFRDADGRLSKQVYRVIEHRTPDLTTPGGIKQWEELEGWDYNYITNDPYLKGMVTDPKAIQTVFEPAGEAPADEAEPELLPIVDVPPSKRPDPMITTEQFAKRLDPPKVRILLDATPEQIQEAELAVKVIARDLAPGSINFLLPNIPEVKDMLARLRVTGQVINLYEPGAPAEEDVIVAVLPARGRYMAEVPPPPEADIKTSLFFEMPLGSIEKMRGAVRGSTRKAVISPASREAARIARSQRSDIVAHFSGEPMSTIIEDLDEKQFYSGLGKLPGIEVGGTYADDPAKWMGAPRYDEIDALSQQKEDERRLAEENLQLFSGKWSPRDPLEADVRQQSITMSGLAGKQEYKFRVSGTRVTHAPSKYDWAVGLSWQDVRTQLHDEIKEWKAVAGTDYAWGDFDTEINEVKASAKFDRNAEKSSRAVANFYFLPKMAGKEHPGIAHLTRAMQEFDDYVDTRWKRVVAHHEKASKLSKEDQLALAASLAGKEKMASFHYLASKLSGTRLFETVSEADVTRSVLASELSLKALDAERASAIAQNMLAGKVTKRGFEDIFAKNQQPRGSTQSLSKVITTILEGSASLGETVKQLVISGADDYQAAARSVASQYADPNIAERIGRIARKKYVIGFLDSMASSMPGMSAVKTAMEQVAASMRATTSETFTLDQGLAEHPAIGNIFKKASELGEHAAEYFKQTTRGGGRMEAPPEATEKLIEEGLENLGEHGLTMEMGQKVIRRLRFEYGMAFSDGIAHAATIGGESRADAAFDEIAQKEKAGITREFNGNTWVDPGTSLTVSVKDKPISFTVTDRVPEDKEYPLAQPRPEYWEKFEQSLASNTAIVDWMKEKALSRNAPPPSLGAAGTIAAGAAIAAQYLPTVQREAFDPRELDDVRRLSREGAEKISEYIDKAGKTARRFGLDAQAKNLWNSYILPGMAATGRLAPSLALYETLWDPDLETKPLIEIADADALAGGELRKNVLLSRPALTAKNLKLYKQHFMSDRVQNFNLNNYALTSELLRAYYTMSHLPISAELWSRSGGGWVVLPSTSWYHAAGEGKAYNSRVAMPKDFWEMARTLHNSPAADAWIDRAAPILSLPVAVAIDWGPSPLVRALGRGRNYIRYAQILGESRDFMASFKKAKVTSEAIEGFVNTRFQGVLSPELLEIITSKMNNPMISHGNKADVLAKELTHWGFVKRGRFDLPLAVDDFITPKMQKLPPTLAAERIRLEKEKGEIEHAYRAMMDKYPNLTSFLETAPREEMVLFERVIGREQNYESVMEAVAKGELPPIPKTVFNAILDHHTLSKEEGALRTLWWKTPGGRRLRDSRIRGELKSEIRRFENLEAEGHASDDTRALKSALTKLLENDDLTAILKPSDGGGFIDARKGFGTVYEGMISPSVERRIADNTRDVPRLREYYSQSPFTGKGKAIPLGEEERTRSFLHQRENDLTQEELDTLTLNMSTDELASSIKAQTHSLGRQLSGEQIALSQLDAMKRVDKFRESIKAISIGVEGGPKAQRVQELLRAADNMESWVRSAEAAGNPSMLAKMLRHWDDFLHDWKRATLFSPLTFPRYLSNNTMENQVRNFWAVGPEGFFSGYNPYDAFGNQLNGMERFLPKENISNLGEKGFALTKPGIRGMHAKYSKWVDETNEIAEHSRTFLFSKAYWAKMEELMGGKEGLKAPVSVPIPPRPIPTDIATPTFMRAEQAAARGEKEFSGLADAARATAERDRLLSEFTEQAKTIDAEAADIALRRTKGELSKQDLGNEMRAWRLKKEAAGLQAGSPEGKNIDRWFEIQDELARREEALVGIRKARETAPTAEEKALAPVAADLEQIFLEDKYSPAIGMMDDLAKNPSGVGRRAPPVTSGIGAPLDTTAHDAWLKKLKAADIAARADAHAVVQNFQGFNEELSGMMSNLERIFPFFGTYVWPTTKLNLKLLATRPAYSSTINKLMAVSRDGQVMADGSIAMQVPGGGKVIFHPQSYWNAQRLVTSIAQQPDAEAENDQANAWAKIGRGTLNIGASTLSMAPPIGIAVSIANKLSGNDDGYDYNARYYAKRLMIPADVALRIAKGATIDEYFDQAPNLRKAVERKAEFEYAASLAYDEKPITRKEAENRARLGIRLEALAGSLGVGADYVSGEAAWQMRGIVNTYESLRTPTERQAFKQSFQNGRLNDAGNLILDPIVTSINYARKDASVRPGSMPAAPVISLPPNTPPMTGPGAPQPGGTGGFSVDASTRPWTPQDFSTKYDDVIEEAAKEFNVSPIALKKNIQAESGFRNIKSLLTHYKNGKPIPDANKGRGLGQIIPANYPELTKRLGVLVNEDTIFDEKLNIRASAALLSDSYALADKDPQLVAEVGRDQAMRRYYIGGSNKSAWGPYVLEDRTFLVGGTPTKAIEPTGFSFDPVRQSMLPIFADGSTTNYSLPEPTQERLGRFGMAYSAYVASLTDPEKRTEASIIGNLPVPVKIGTQWSISIFHGPSEDQQEGFFSSLGRGAADLVGIKLGATRSQALANIRNIEAMNVLSAMTNDYDAAIKTDNPELLRSLAKKAFAGEYRSGEVNSAMLLEPIRMKDGSSASLLSALDSVTRQIVTDGNATANIHLPAAAGKPGLLREMSLTYEAYKDGGLYVPDAMRIRWEKLKKLDDENEIKALGPIKDYMNRVAHNIDSYDIAREFGNISDAMRRIDPHGAPSVIARLARRGEWQTLSDFAVADSADRADSLVRHFAYTRDPKTDRVIVDDLGVQTLMFHGFGEEVASWALVRNDKDLLKTVADLGINAEDSNADFRKGRTEEWMTRSGVAITPEMRATSGGWLATGKQLAGILRGTTPEDPSEAETRGFSLPQTPRLIGDARNFAIRNAYLGPLPNSYSSTTDYVRKTVADTQRINNAIQANMLLRAQSIHRPGEKLYESWVARGDTPEQIAANIKEIADIDTQKINFFSVAAKNLAGLPPEQMARSAAAVMNLGYSLGAIDAEHLRAINRGIQQAETTGTAHTILSNILGLAGNATAALSLTERVGQMRQQSRVAYNKYMAGGDPVQLGNSEMLARKANVITYGNAAGELLSIGAGLSAAYGGPEELTQGLGTAGGALQGAMMGASMTAHTGPGAIIGGIIGGAIGYFSSAAKEGDDNSNKRNEVMQAQKEYYAAAQANQERQASEAEARRVSQNSRSLLIQQGQKLQQSPHLATQMSRFFRRAQFGSSQGLIGQVEGSARRQFTPRF